VHVNFLNDSLPLRKAENPLNPLILSSSHFFRPFHLLLPPTAIFSTLFFIIFSHTNDNGQHLGPFREFFNYGVIPGSAPSTFLHDEQLVFRHSRNGYWQMIFTRSRLERGQLPFVAFFPSLEQPDFDGLGTPLRLGHPNGPEVTPPCYCLASAQLFYPDLSWPWASQARSHSQQDQIHRSLTLFYPILILGNVFSTDKPSSSIIGLQVRPPLLLACSLARRFRTCSWIAPLSFYHHNFVIPSLTCRRDLLCFFTQPHANADIASSDELYTYSLNFIPTPVWPHIP